MNNENLEVFIDGAANYFKTVSDNPADVGAPFLIQDINEYLLDFTGIIGISGEKRGSVFFSAPRKMLIQLIASLGVLTTQDDKLMDLVGEVSNTVSGNARREFGEQFLLSVPVVIQGKGDGLKVSNVAEIYVIPITWKSFKANLIINLD